MDTWYDIRVHWNLNTLNIKIIVQLEENLAQNWSVIII